MSSRFCASCGSPIAAAARFCPSCGADQEQFAVGPREDETPASSPTPRGPQPEAPTPASPPHGQEAEPAPSVPAPSEPVPVPDSPPAAGVEPVAERAGPREAIGSAGPQSPSRGGSGAEGPGAGAGAGDTSRDAGAGGAEGGESLADRLGPEASELAGELAAGLRLPGVLAALLSAAFAALAVLAAAFLLAAAFSDDSLIGLVGRDVGIVTEAFRQVVQMLLADVLTVGLFEPESERLGPAVLVAIPLGACAVAAASQASRTEGLSARVRLAFGAATGVPFGLLMLIASLAAGSSDDIDPSIAGAFGYGLLWGALGGVLGTAATLRREGSPAARRGRARSFLTVTEAALKPLGLLLVAALVIGTGAWLYGTVADVGNARANRSEATAVLENGLYMLEHGLHFAELGALVEFEPPGTLEALGLPLPASDASAVADGGDTFRLFGYRDGMANYVFIPLLLVGVALPVVLALYAGFAVARLRVARTLSLGAAWGAVVGPAWAVAMGILDELVGQRLFGEAEGDSVFATFLLGGTALGALGGLLAARAAAGREGSTAQAGPSASPDAPQPSGARESPRSV